MGDLIMSSPAIRALKETFSCKITVLTSSMAAAITPFIAEIDDVIVNDLPWIKADNVIVGDAIFNLVKQLAERKFDAAVIFTVFSQNAMPAAMIAYMADIPLRLAYSRENPYMLLSNWVPDKEPYLFILHQVERDLELVGSIKAATGNICLHLNIPETACEKAKNKLLNAGLNREKKWLIFHAAVSEKKREYPKELWIEAAKKIIEEKDFQVFFTGTKADKNLCEELTIKTGKNAFSAAGLFELDEFIALIKQSPLIVSVNTGPIHIAAAVKTPVVVLYAQTNPQHTPWMTKCKVLEFEVEKNSRSKNEVIQYLYREVYNKTTPMPTANDVVDAINNLLE